MFQIIRDSFEVGDVLAKIEARKRPPQYTTRAATRIKKEKSLPIHSQHACHDAVQLAQHIEEPCESDGESAIAREDRFDLADALGVDAKSCPVAKDNPPAKPPSKQIANVVTGYGPCPGRKHQKWEGYFAARRKNRSEDEQRFSGTWK